MLRIIGKFLGNSVNGKFSFKELFLPKWKILRSVINIKYFPEMKIVLAKQASDQNRFVHALRF